ncbi:LOW QUALITY PROTEIN: cysteine protease ATG4B-like [Haliotis rubra]|uniref:LOW QUALITY PROTEIN: cysteine protease ATG4B-like n=1 Tax=Haliotis rubra TaxID=36100 RepID=UPI001EE5E221|nr:LOW QUALITY PROTEIN: cysteine protease ATG4B-like [Haliotis rubra]
MCFLQQRSRMKVVPYSMWNFQRQRNPCTSWGEKYSTLYDMEDLKHDIVTRLWFTYRKNFAHIGGSGPNSDQGWGCMLRCGQMMLAQALCSRHLGRAWRWEAKEDNSDYWRLLKMFQDKKSSVYSIHQIASMGESEGKAIGQWFGPNTIAQVLKKIAVYDDWSSLVIHVAMDNTVIEDDIRKLCRLLPENGTEYVDMNGSDSNVFPSTRSSRKTQPFTISGSLQTQPFSRGGRTHSPGSSHCLGRSPPRKPVNLDKWKPLLLIIPLRLGLTDINPVYFDSLKSCLALKQSVGIIGGKPNHAHWFIGYLGEELVYLDPHTTQQYTDLDPRLANDDSYHCPFPSRMRLSQLDPSVAVGFYCGTEEEFTDLCLTFNKFIIKASKTPMFELHKVRPPHWPPVDTPPRNRTTSNSDFTVLDSAEGGTKFDSEEEFEIL